MYNIHISIQEADFNISNEIEFLKNNTINTGSIANFIGYVRAEENQNSNNQVITSMLLEHYEGMTQDTIHHISTLAIKRWSITGIRIIHRIGHLQVNSHIVFVACAAAKRIAALSGCEFIITQLKVNAPFWKKEYFSDGTSAWVKPSVQDLLISELDS